MKKFAAFVLAAASVAAIDFAQAADRRVRIFNDTHLLMKEFNATPSENEGWGKNFFRRNGLYPNTDVLLDLDDGSNECLFDLRAVFEGGDVVTRHQYNVCGRASWRISS